MDDVRDAAVSDADPEIETYTEYRLSGQPPNGFPPYDLTFHDPARIDNLRVIFERVAKPDWADVQFRKREVTIVRTPWEDTRG